MKKKRIFKILIYSLMPITGIFLGFGCDLIKYRYSIEVAYGFLKLVAAFGYGLLLGILSNKLGEQ